MRKHEERKTKKEMAIRLIRKVEGRGRKLKKTKGRRETKLRGRN